jgi:hypothetical protein
MESYNGLFAVDNGREVVMLQAFMQQQMSLWVSEMTGAGVCGGGCR